MIPLRLSVEVYSGIAPPKALLEAMAASRGKDKSRPDHPPLPLRPPEPNSYGDDAALPSYEDAIADSLGPLEGPRREYNTAVDGGDEAVAGQKHDKSTRQKIYYSDHSASTGSSDALPSSPSDHDPGSPSPIDHPSDIAKTAHSPPQYQPAADPEPGQCNQAQRSAQGSAMPCLGVPHRKPLPGPSNKDVH